VPRGDDPPYAIDDNKIYVREEAETTLAVRDEIVQLVLRGRGQPARAAAPAAAAEAAKPAPVEAAPVEPAVVPVAPAPPVPATPPAGVGAPRTGVEIVATDERDGSRYHTMRDLRNGSVVKNVTRSSARKLWHYAISAKESGALNPSHVTWLGDIGLWRRTHKGGATRYDLVQRADGEMRVFYGVTEDGIHGAWRRLIEGLPEAAPSAAAQATEGLPSPAAETEPESAAEQQVAGLVAQEQAQVAEMAREAAEMAAPEAMQLAAAPANGALESEPEAESDTAPADGSQEAPAAKGRPRGRSTKKTAAKSKAPARKSTKTRAAPASRSRAKRPASPAE